MDDTSGYESRLTDAERALVDERADRVAAQRQLADAEERVGIWRTRAEERAERIARLEGDREELRSVQGWMRSRFGRARAHTDPATADLPRDSDATRPDPVLPGVMTAHNLDGSLGRVLAESNDAGLDAANWDAVDLVAADPERLSEQSLGDLLEFSALRPRPALAVIDDGSGRWGDADVLISRRDGDHGLHLPESLDPVRDSPAWAPRDDRALSAEGQRRRRESWRHHDPAVLLEILLDAAQVPHRPPEHRVAGLLVTNRPENILHAIDLFAGQTLEHIELVVGCHGISGSHAEQYLRERHPDLASSVLEFDPAWSLGRCLNQSAASTSAGLLAKIDDDDHYGPGYLEDAVQALRYAGAGVVGKGAQFTYVEGVDRTVLRRAGTEETFVKGILTGASLVFRRHVWDSVGFPDRPRKVDVHFLGGVHAIGVPVYANGRWEFVYRRGTAGHTWDADDETFLAQSTKAWDGWRPERSEL